MGYEWLGTQGERGHEVTFKLLWADKFVSLEVPSKTIKEILDEVGNMMSASVVGIRRLRSLAGKVLRLRWAANMVYAAVTAVDEDVMEGVEEQRRRNRKDTRDKAAWSRCDGLPA